MTDKPHAFFALPGHGVVTLEGRDAIDFSQAQFMSDVGALADGGWQWSGWLTPKGRVVALFALLRRGPESVWLVLPDADRESFATALRRFVFRSKVAIATPDLPVSAQFRLSAQSGGVALDMSGEGGARTLFVGGEAAPVDLAALAIWDAADLAHGLPRLPPSQAEKWTPQQLSLERLRAYSVKKGCYPGQEIVARTHFLGKAKRGLALLEGNSRLSAGDRVTTCGQEIGVVVSAVDTLALAVLPSVKIETPLQAHGLPVLTRNFLGGLARD